MISAYKLLVLILVGTAVAKRGRGSRTRRQKNTESAIPPANGNPLPQQGLNPEINGGTSSQTNGDPNTSLNGHFLPQGEGSPPSNEGEGPPQYNNMSSGLLRLSGAVNRLANMPACFAETNITMIEMNGYLTRTRSFDPTLLINPQFLCALTCVLQGIGFESQMNTVYQGIYIMLKLAGKPGEVMKSCIERIDEKKSICSKIKDAEKCAHGAFDQVMEKTTQTTRAKQLTTLPPKG